MKLLIYSHAFAPQVGGIETFAMNLASGLAKMDLAPENNVTVTVVTKVPASRDDAFDDHPFRVVRNPGLLQLWRLVGDADRILLAGPAIVPLVFALLRRRVLIVSHHGYQSICPNGMLFQFPTQTCCPGHFSAGRYWECLKCNSPQQNVAGSLRSLLLTFVRRALCWSALSNVAVSQHVSVRISLPHLRVIRNGVPHVPQSLSFSTATDLPKAPIAFAYIGRLVTEKGVSVLVEAARLLRNRGCQFQILIIGDGPERDALTTLTSSLNLVDEVRFLGFQTGAELLESMSRASALVMPSVCEDAAPMAALEQMMQGRLIIGSKIGGLAEEIGEAGLTFAPGNPLALADCMQRVIEKPELIIRLGAQARARVVMFYPLERMIHEYQALLASEDGGPRS